MIVDQSIVRGLSFVSVLNPFLAFLENFFFFDIKVPFDYLFETFGRIFYLTDHGVANITKSNNIGICLVFTISLFGSLLAFEAGLVEIYILAHGNTLGGDE